MAKKVIQSGGASWITIKACKGYHFFDIYSIAGKNRRRKLLSPPFFHEALPLAQLAQLPSRQKEQIIRGYADTFLFLAPAILSYENNQNELKDLFDWFRIELNIVHVKKSGKNLFELQIVPNVPLLPPPTDESRQCIHIYSQGHQKIRPILVASPNVRTAIWKLSEVWHNPLAKTVLLSAYSGSGKEELKELLMYGLGVKKNQIVELSAPQVASSQNPLQDIYNNLNKKKLINTKHGKLVKKPVVLYLDEIHHDDVQKLRTALLRFIETTELTTDSKNFDCKGMLFLFAASKPPAELRILPPPDFWTRVEYTVTMKHPLQLKNPDDRNDILKQYFCLFWRLSSLERQKVDKSQVINILTDHTHLKRLSEDFAKVLDSPLIPLISIRTMKSIVSRLFSRAIYHALTNKNVDKDEMITEIASAMETSIIEICEEIVPEIKPQGVF